MGCVSSKKDINDLHPNIFQVMNVDQLGNRISPGQLEITDTDLVLYQRKKSPVKWPLRRLRRYGFEGELFSFESGRRCPTGHGIYAFHCLRAERLFNIVQAHIQVRNIVDDDGVVREFPSIGPVPLRITPEGNYLEPSPFTEDGFMVLSSGVGTARRPGSVGSSNGPLSPHGGPSSPTSLLPPAPPPPPPPLPPIPTSLPFHDSNEYNNNNNNNNNINQRTYINSSSVVSSDSVICQLNQDSAAIVGGDLDSPQTLPAYSNVELGSAIGPLSPSFSVDGDSNYARLEVGRTYMNVVPRPEISVPFARVTDRKLEESRHCYVNLEPSEIEVARSHLPKRLSGCERLPHLPSPLSPPGTVRQVNYIVLDLEQSKKDTNPSQQQPTTPVSAVPMSSLNLPQDLPGKASEGYATIDFNKTDALFHSVNPNVDNDSEGSRKTRHNSTINDLALSSE